jgi:hypothetical protein
VIGSRAAPTQMMNVPIDSENSVISEVNDARAKTGPGRR